MPRETPPQALRLDLPDADVVYFPDAIPDASQSFDALMATTPWVQEKITVYGKRHDMPRLTCWMGEASYTYSGLLNAPAPWTPDVMKVRAIAEDLSDETFNGVLLNLYRSGRDSMGCHADDEPSLGPTPIIASVNLGATRRFRFKPRVKGKAEPMVIDLDHGSMLLMRGETQKNYLHEVPKTKKDVGPRINLTFRRVIGDVA